jgi:hypothetical protein
MKISDLDMNNPEHRKVYAELRKQRDTGGGMKANLTINN